MNAEDVELIENILIKLRAGPLFYYDLLTGFPRWGFRQIMVAWGKVREEYELFQDTQGRYYIEAAKDDSND